MSVFWWRHSARRKPKAPRNPAGNRPRLWGHKPLLEWLEPRLALATIIVTTTNDDLMVDGTISLREAITSINNGANVNADVNAVGTYGVNDTIDFAIPGAGVQTISVGGSGNGALPTINKPVLIDGTTQPGFAGSPSIKLDGVSAGSADGLDINASSVVVKSLDIVRFTGSFGIGNGIVLNSGASNTILQGNYVGIDTDGLTAMGFGQDAILVNSNNSTIGGLTTQARNVISGNSSGDGILIFGANNVVEGNYVGLDAMGSTNAVPNGNVGVEVVGDGNTIGGTIAGAGNVVSGNSNEGVQLEGLSNLVAGNFLGTNAAGTAPVSVFSEGLQSDGVDISSQAANNTVGGTITLARNVISGNGNDGVRLEAGSGTGNLIEGNFIGTDVTGTLAVGNGALAFTPLFGGVDVEADGNTVGGTTAGAGNVISGNTGDGVALGSSNNLVAGNFIGTTFDGSAALGNAASGVSISSANNTIGGADALATNVISGNGVNLSGSGVYINGTAATGNLVERNLIGTDATGQFALPNQAHGVWLDQQASDNTVGGPVASTGNVISGNRQDGIFVSNNAAGNVIRGNGIGTNAAGSSASGTNGQPLGNGKFGIEFNNSSLNTVDNAGDPTNDNVISGNLQGGISMTGNGAPAGAVAWYRADGDAVDSVSGHNGTLQGGAKFAPGIEGQAFSFSANGDGVSIPNSADFTFGTSDFTVEAWVKTSANYTGGIGMIFDDYGSTETNGADYRLFIDTNNHAALFLRDAGFGTLTAAGTTAINDGNWHHVVGLRLGATGYIYVDGNLQGSQTNAALGAVTNIGSPAFVHIGGTNTSAASQTSAATPEAVFVGQIDELALYRRALSAGEIQAIFNDGGASKGGNTITGNFIGTDVHGTTALPNQGDGVGFIGSADNILGGSAVIQRNVISGNTPSGVMLDLANSQGNVVAGNYIGTAANGTTALGNQVDGVFVLNGASNNVIGGTAGGAGNVISGNTGRGVEIEGQQTTGNLVQGNLIGTDFTGTVALGNHDQGIVLGDATGNLIGGTEAGAGNVISANAFNGVSIGAGLGNTVQGNLIGTDVHGQVALGNGLDGVFIDGPNNSVTGNVISGNSQSGVEILGAGATANLVNGNDIGTDSNGLKAIPNAANGVIIDSGASGNTIGGNNATDRNIISGNANIGVDIVDATTTNNLVRGDYIGTNVSGTAALANRDGVVIDNAANNMIDPLHSASVDNLVSGNLRYGVYIHGSSATGNNIFGNQIGTDPSGTVAVGNGQAGVYLAAGANNNQIGGGVGLQNTISGNGAGVLIDHAPNNVLAGNFIGTTLSGTQPLGNTLFGVQLTNSAGTLVGRLAGFGFQPNVIAGNGTDGLILDGAGTTGSVIVDNFIGTDLTGQIDLHNGQAGVRFQNGASGNLLGDSVGAGALENTILYNKGPGVVVQDAAETGDSIRGNSIALNGALGIDLGNDGVTLNGANPLPGPNNWQPFPVLSQVLPGDTTEVKGTFQGQPNKTYLLDFYLNTQADQSGFGQGQTYVGTAQITTNASGTFSLDQSFFVAAMASDLLTVTATDLAGNTSEFSPAIGTNFAVAPTVIIDSPPTTGQEGTPIKLTSTVTDPDLSDTFTYAWKATLNGAPFATGSEPTFTLTPTVKGTYQVTLIVTATNPSLGFGGLGFAPPATINVTPAGPLVSIDNAPVSSPVNQPLNLTSTVNLFGSGATPQYFWTASLNGTVVASSTDPTSSSFGFTPTALGLYTIKLTVQTNSGGTGSATALVQVVSLIPAAQISGAPTTSPEGVPILLTAAVTDPTLVGNLTYAWTVTKNGAIFTSQSTNQPNFTYTPDDEGVYQVLLSVSDNQAHTGVATPATTTATNVSPTPAIQGVPANPTAGTAITLTGTFTDPSLVDGHVLHWSVLSSTGQQIAPADGATFTFTPQAAGLFVVNLLVTDEDGGTGSASVTLQVNGQSRTVVISAPANPLEGSPVPLSATVTNGPSGVTYTFAWTVTDQSGLYSTTGAGSSFTFQPPAPGVYKVDVLATGNDGSSGSLSQNITVANVPPTAQIAVSPSGDLFEGNQITLTGTAIDPGGAADTPSFVWSVTGPDGFTASGKAPTLQFTAPDVGDYNVSLTATDLSNQAGPTTTLTLHVKAVPLNPIISDGGTSPDAKSVHLTAQVNDPGHDDTFTYGWSVSLNGFKLSIAAGLGGPFQLQAVGPDLFFRPFLDGQYLVSLTVSDLGDGVAASTTSDLFFAAPGTNLTLTQSQVPAGATQVTAYAMGNNVIDASQLQVPAVLVALGGNNTLILPDAGGVAKGDSGTNKLIGGAGSNTFFGVGQDQLFGGSGTNLFNLIPGAGEMVQAGTAPTSTNTLSFAAATSAVTVDLRENAGQPQTLDSTGDKVMLQGQFQNLYGSNFADLLFAANGTNVHGGSGNDSLMAVNVSDATLTAGSGKALLMAENSSNAQLFGGTGSATLMASGGTNITMFGGSGGSESLIASSGTNISMFGGTGGNDSVFTSGGTAISMFGGTGGHDMTAVSGGTAITMFGGTGGNDSTFASGGTNISMFGGTGGFDSVLASGGTNISMFGGTGGQDSVFASGGTAITMFGGTGGQDSVMGSGGTAITMFGGSGGNDSVFASGGTNISMFGGSGGNDSVFASGGTNISMFGGTGNNDSVQASGGTAITMFGGTGGNDSVMASGGTNISMFGGSGNNDAVQASGGTAISMFGGTGGNDSVFASGGTAITMFGGTGGNDSVMTSGGTNISMFGGGGNNDSVFASGGTAITMFGGTGNQDAVQSSGGTAITMFGGSGGNDSVFASGGTNISLFGGTGNNDAVQSSGGTAITMFGGTGGNDSVMASGGTNISMFGGTGNNDAVQSSGGTAITMFGGSGGSDSVMASGGTNISMFGGTGNNDAVQSSGGTAITMFGGSGTQDVVQSSGGTAITMFGGSGGNDSVFASGGTNISMFGGTGNNDAVQSSGGTAITMFGGSGTQDVVQSSGGTAITMFGGTGGNDSVMASGGTNISMFGGTGNNDVVQSSGGTAITMFGGSGTQDVVQSSGGTAITMFGGTGGNDSVFASGGTNISMFGGTGNNDAVQSSGDTAITMFGGTGNQDMVAQSGGTAITMFGGSGNQDVVQSSGGTAITMFGGSGGNDSVFASGGTNISMFGGTGNNDAIQSSGGTAITMFGGSGSNDAVQSSGGTAITMFGGSGSNDSVFASGGTNISMFGGTGNNDAVQSSGGTVITMFGGTGNNDSVFASGGTSLTLFGGSGNNDSVFASGGTNISMYGGTGSQDSISAVNVTSAQLIAAGNSGTVITETDGTTVLLFGGAGNDTLIASGGTGIFLDGEDGNNTYELQPSSDMALTATASDLLTIGQNLDLIDGQSNGVNTLMFPASSGITLDLSQTSTGNAATIVPQTVATGINLSLIGLFQDVDGTAGPDQITGNSANDVIFAGSGNATLVAGSGATTLVAGTGNDSLVGGSGGTTYRFIGNQFGSDVIDQPLSNQDDVLDFQQLGGAATINLGQAGSGSKTGTGHGPQQVTHFTSPGSSNLILTLSNSLAIDRVLTSGNGDVVVGNGRNDQFLVTTGNNSFTGGGGNDSYYFSGSSFGLNTINEPTSNNSLNFRGVNGPINLDLSTPGQQTLTPNNALGLTLQLNTSAFTTVVGTLFSDVIKGNAGNDTIIGGGGLDSLVAGNGGNDFIQVGITQVVLLDFNSSQPFGSHFYTQAERDLIQQRLEAIYQDFAVPDGSNPNQSIVFTQDPAMAQQLSQPTGGRYITVTYNAGPAGGASNELDFLNLDLGGNTTVNVNPLLGGTNQPSATVDPNDLSTDNYVNLSVEITAHEIGHQYGLRHADAYGPIGSGIYTVYDSNGNVIGGVNPSRPAGAATGYIPGYPVPANHPLVTAPETPQHVMASPDSLGITLFDSVAQTFFGEREAVKLAFDYSGVTVISQAGQSFATAQPLTLGGLQVPNTLVATDPANPPLHFGQQFNVAAIDVVGALQDVSMTDPVSGNQVVRSTDDYYRFTGRQGDLMNFELISQALTRNTHPFDTVLSLYDANGNLLIYNDDELETHDSSIIDYVLPADGTYYLKVDSFNPPGGPDQADGNYELYLFRFASNANTTSIGQGSTLVAGAGNDVLIGSPANDLFTFAPGLTGTYHYTVRGGSGQNTLDETGLPGSQTAGLSTVDFSGITTVVPSNTPAPTVVPINGQTVVEGQLLSFTATTTDHGVNHPVRFHLEAVPAAGTVFPAGATIDPVSGLFSWVPADEGGGSFQVRVVAVDTAGRSGSADVTIIVTDQTPTNVAISVTDQTAAASSVANPPINEGDTLLLHGGFTETGDTDGHTFRWQVLNSKGQSVAQATTQDFNFVPHEEGTYTLTFTVADASNPANAVSTTSQLVVSDVAPVIQDIGVKVNGVTAASANEGDTVTLHGDFTDAGGTDTQVLSWTVLKDGQPFTTGTGQDFSFSPNDGGSYAITLTVSDDPTDPDQAGSTVPAPAAMMTLTLPVYNVPLSVAPITAQTVNQGDPVSLHADFTDKGGASDSDTFSWIVVSTNGQMVPDSGTQNLSFTALDAGTYTAFFTVTNPEDHVSASIVTTVTVLNVAPSAVGLNLASGTIPEGGTAVLGGSFTDPGPLDTHTLLIAWGDQSTSTVSLGQGVTTFSGLSHVYQDSVPGQPHGSYPITVTVTDDHNASGIGTTSIEVDDAAPVVAITNAPAVNPADAMVENPEGTPITLGSLVTNADTRDQTDGFTFAWSVTKNGAAFPGQQSGGSFGFTPDDDGTYVVSVTATTKDGVTGPATSLTIVATHVKPTALFASAGAVTEGQQATVSFSQQMAASPLDQAAGFTYSYDFDNSGVFEVVDSPNASATFTPPAEEGVYTVVGRIKNQDGVFTDYTTTVVVHDAALSAQNQTISGGTEGKTGPATNVLVATFTDADPAGTLADYSATVQWDTNPNSPDTAEVVSATIQPDATVKGQYDVYATKADPYAEEGTHTVLVTIQDQGGSFQIASSTATVMDAALTAKAVTVNATEGAPVTSGVLVATFTDADANGTAADYSATVNWGDGDTTVPGSLTIAPDSTVAGQFDVYASKTNPYAEEGSKTITVVITDTPGTTAMALSTDNISDAKLTAQAVSPLAPATKGISYTATLATFTDADPNGTAGDYATTTIDWNDGSKPTSASIVPDPHGGFDVQGTHTYHHRRSYTLTVTINDAGASAVVHPTLTVQAKADLALNAKVDNPLPFEGSTIHYTLTVDDKAGPGDASGVQVTNVLPAGVTLTGSSPSQGTFNSSTGVWTVGALPKGSSATLTLTATVNSGTAGSNLTDSASITAEDQVDPNPANNSASATAHVPVQLFKMVFGSGPAVPGFTSVLPTVLYSAARGYGWIVPSGGTAPSGFDNRDSGGHPLPNDPLLEDGHTGSDDIFADDLPAGSYLVTLVMGDAATSHDQIYAKIDGTTVLSNLTLGRGQFISQTFPVTLAADQQLQVELSSTDSRSSFALNALTARPAPVAAITWSGPTTLVADGTSTATFTGSVNLPDGSFVTVTTNLGTITAVSAADGSLVADANPNYTGVQAVVKGGSFKVVLQAGTAAGTATLAGREVTGAATGSTTITLMVSPARKFQFVASLADVVSGEIGVLPSSLYSASRGYGWTSWGSAVHRTDGTNAFRSDGEIGTTGVSDNTFRVQIDPTRPSYTFTVYYGDYDAAHTAVVYVNDATTPTDTVVTAMGVFVTRTYTVAKANFPSSGILDIRFTGTAATGFFFVNGVDLATPLQASGLADVNREPVTPLTPDALAPVVAEAEQLWLASGLTPAQAEQLRGAQVSIARLGGAGYLGVTAGEQVTLDATAAGYGWFIDARAWDPAAFGRPGAGTEVQAAPGSPAYGHMDLLTVVLHELGHVVGLPDLDPRTDPHILMTETLEPGTRRLLTTTQRPSPGLEELPLQAVPGQPLAVVINASLPPASAGRSPAGASRVASVPPPALDWLFARGAVQRVWTAAPFGDGRTGHLALTAAASPSGLTGDERAVSLGQAGEPATGAPPALGAADEGKAVTEVKKTAPRAADPRRWFKLLEEFFGW
jgi:hypothetical protein